MSVHLIRCSFNRGCGLNILPPIIFYTMEHILLNGQKLYPANEVARYFGIDPSSMNKWLRKHEEFRNNNAYIFELGGEKKPKRYFTELGVTIYGTIKNISNGNQYIPTKGAEHPLKESKLKLAEYAHEQKQQTKYLLQDPIIAQLESLIEIRAIQLDQEKRIKEQEERILRLESLSEIKRIEQITSEQKLLAFPEPKKQAPQRTVRSLVVEYVNAYAHNTGLPHNVVWSKIYKEYSIRTRINLKTRAQSHKLSPLEYVEQNGDIEILYAIAKEIL